MGEKVMSFTVFIPANNQEKDALKARSINCSIQLSNGPSS